MALENAIFFSGGRLFKGLDDNLQSSIKLQKNFDGDYEITVKMKISKVDAEKSILLYKDLIKVKDEFNKELLPSNLTYLDDALNAKDESLEIGLTSSTFSIVAYPDDKAEANGGNITINLTSSSARKTNQSKTNQSETGG